METVNGSNLLEELLGECQGLRPQGPTLHQLYITFEKNEPRRAGRGSWSLRTPTRATPLTALSWGSLVSIFGLRSPFIQMKRLKLREVNPTRGGPWRTEDTKLGCPALWARSHPTWIGAQQGMQLLHLGLFISKCGS